MANQIDITPATTPALGLHVHAPAGSTTSAFNHSTDFPSVTAGATPNSQSKAVKTTVSGVRFANPS